MGGSVLLLLLSLLVASADENSQHGKASWYSYKAGVCAHRSLPIGTTVRVTNLETGKSTTCRVADRGPFVKGRIIDLDRRDFAKIASLGDGVFPAKITW